MKEIKTHTEYLKEAKELAKSKKASYKLAVLSSFTCDFLKSYIVVESHKIGCFLNPWFGPFNQFEQLILDEKSDLWKNRPDIIWMAIRVEDIEHYYYNEFAGLTFNEAKYRIEVLRGRIVGLVKAARERFNGCILVSNLTPLEQMLMDIFDVNNPHGMSYLFAEQNCLLAKDISEINGAYLFDYADCIATQGIPNWKDNRLWYMARMPMNHSALPLLAYRLARTIAATVCTPSKCIVLDLDNTLWGGVIGDDGPEGIKLGDDYPGSVFKDFQASLLSYKKKGFLLAIASKNDEKIVRQALDEHPEMILRTKDFAAIQANWEPKPISIRRIAEILNIGLDSLIFIDDNPVECASVEAELPMVRVVNLPVDPLGYQSVLQNIPELDRPKILEEDRSRAEMYHQEARRRESSLGYKNIQGFLEDLDMEAKVGVLSNNTIERIHQLIQKTNQFNLTTRRHSLEQIKLFSERDDSEVAWLRLRDKFGDSGLVCVGIIKEINNNAWEIDTFLMSCRVMGRGVENAFLSYLSMLALKNNAKRLRGLYIKTPKNKPVEKFYLEHGFEETKNIEDDYQPYEIELNPKTFAWPKHIKLPNDN